MMMEQCYRRRIHKPRWRAIRNYTLSMVAGAVLALGMVWMGFSAMEREDQIRDDIRRARCAAYGENLPVQLQTYCDNL